MNENPLILINQIDEFIELHEFMNDKELDEALHLIIKLFSKPDVLPATAQKLIVQLQAYSAKFSLLATIYGTIRKGKPGSDEYLKKNVYYTTADVLDKLVQSLKYSFK